MEVATPPGPSPALPPPVAVTFLVGLATLLEAPHPSPLLVAKR